MARLATHVGGIKNELQANIPMPIVINFFDRVVNLINEGETFA